MEEKKKKLKLLFQKKNPLFLDYTYYALVSQQTKDCDVIYICVCEVIDIYGIMIFIFW